MQFAVYRYGHHEWRPQKASQAEVCGCNKVLGFRARGIGLSYFGVYVEVSIFMETTVCCSTPNPKPSCVGLRVDRSGNICRRTSRDLTWVLQWYPLILLFWGLFM